MLLICLISKKTFDSNLTNLHLGGVIPKDIADLTALTQLLLGNNSLSSHIPDLSSLKNLTILQLQNNQFTGEIPKSLEKLQMLTQLFLQGNKLEGTVSRGLVRPNLELRVDPQNDAVVGSRKIKGWVIGLSIMCSVMLVLGILSGIFLWKHKHPSQPFQSSNGRVPSQQHTFAGASTILNEENENDYHRLAVQYTEEDIKTSTNNYSKPIGKGSFGSVFYGRLSGFEVAVKIHKTDSNQGRKEFQNEVAMLSRIHHKNLVNLIGYCRQPITARLARGLELELEYRILKILISTVWVRRMGMGIRKKWNPVSLFAPQNKDSVFHQNRWNCPNTCFNSIFSKLSIPNY